MLTAARQALRERPGARLIVALSVLGPVTTPAQRRTMGAAAAALADELVLTGDRVFAGEPTDRLPAGLEEGASGGSAAVTVEPDRGAALEMAIARARPGDAVLVLGRGVRTSSADGRFSDREEAAKIVSGGPGHG